MAHTEPSVGSRLGQCEASQTRPCTQPVLLCTTAKHSMASRVTEGSPSEAGCEDPDARGCRDAGALRWLHRHAALRAADGPGHRGGHQLHAPQRRPPRRRQAPQRPPRHHTLGTSPPASPAPGTWQLLTRTSQYIHPCIPPSSAASCSPKQQLSCLVAVPGSNLKLSACGTSHHPVAAHPHQSRHLYYSSARVP